MMFLWNLLLFVHLSFGVFAQLEYECPKGWIEYSYNCYKFIRSPLKSRDQALIGCQIFNAVLLSVETMEEHSFVLDWLRQNDPQHRTWYTSGVDVGNNLWRWQGTDSPFVNMDAAWLPHQFGNEKFAAYNYSEVASRWGLLKVPGFQDLPYICEVRRDLSKTVVQDERGYDYGLIVKEREEIPRAPYIIKEPVDAVFDISARNNVDDVYLRCVAGGYPPPSYEWFQEEYKDDRLELKRVDPLTNWRITITDGTLKFYKPEQFVDRGTYHCRASNKYGTVVSQSVKLTFGYIGQFNLKRSNEFGRENWGKAIYCDPPQHYPDVIYYWARDYLPNFVDEDKRVFVSQDGNLYFSSVETIDQGKYSCVVQSSVSGTGRTGPFFTLDVQSYSSNQQLQFPNNFPKAFPEAPFAGQDVHLECLAFGYPVPAYNWTRKGFSSQLPMNSSMAKYNRVLVLPKVAVEDMGEYICTASNGRNSISASVTLSIQSKPIFTIPLQDMHVDKGADLTWTCEAFGIPEVRYDWLRNGEYLNRTIQQDDFIRYRIQDNFLTIRTLNPTRDQGVYQCKATNQLGSTFSSGELRVLTLKPSFKKYPINKETYAAEGGNLTLNCRPEGAPTPQFQWRRNGQMITQEGGRVTIHRNGYLIITGVRPQDQGRYSCMAQNEYGRDESSGEVFVLRSPSFVQRPRNPVIAMVNATLRLNCEVQAPSLLDLGYVWRINGIRSDEFGHHRYVPGPEPGSLMIYNLTFYDYGTFECQARTPIHQISATTFLTVEGPPGKPGGLQTLATKGHTVRLQWTDGAYHGKSLSSFDIEARTTWNRTWVMILKGPNLPPSALTNLGRREAVIDGSILAPWSQYEFRITPKNVYGAGEPSDPSPAQTTKEERPRKYPANIGGGGGNVGDLTITWDPMPPQDQNAPGIWYRIFYKPADSGDSDYRSEDLRSMGNIGLKVVRVGEKNYYRQYKVKVQAINNQGVGPVSPDVTIYSAEDRPNAVPSEVAARAYNSTAIRVWWKPIDLSRESIRGKLIGFRIKYWKKDVETPDDATFHLSRNTTNSALIVGLQPNAYYSIVAMSFNGAGSSTESEPFIERTFKSAPLKPPNAVKVEPLSPSSIQVTWRSSAPSQIEEPLAGFKVRYWEADQDFSTYTDEYVKLGGDLIAIVRNLTPGKVYKLRVLAYSQGGDGRMSSPAFEFQLGDAETLRGGVAPLSSFNNFILIWIVSVFFLCRSYHWL